MNTQLKMMLATLLLMVVSVSAYAFEISSMSSPSINVFQTTNLTPMIGEEGFAVEPYSNTSAGPRRARGGCTHVDTDRDGLCDYCKEPVHIGTGNGSDVDWDPLPIGSAVLPLLLMALGYGYIQYKKKELV